jgi:hypothetical protein
MKPPFLFFCHKLLRFGFALFFAMLANISIGATFSVTFTNDSGPGSLRSAIASANSTAGPNVIQFATTGQFASAATISLVTPLPTISQSTKIVGRSVNPITISGAGQTTLFSFASNTTNSLNSLILANGAGTNWNGSAISNAGVLTISSCVVSNNKLYGGYGAAIFNSGTINIGNSALLNNTNLFGWGGAAYNSGNLTVANSLIASNSTLAGIGGGIWNSSNLVINSSSIIYNLAYGGDGAVGGGGGGGGGFGGGIFSTNGNCFFTNNTVMGNTVRGGNGSSGGYGAGGGFSGSTGGGAGGGSGGYAGGGGGSDYGIAGGFGGGGGVAYYTANGGFGSGGQFGGNGSFRGSGGGGAGLGGGMFIHGGIANMQNCTFIGNTATYGVGANAGNGVCGGIFITNATVTFHNTIVAKNSASTTVPDIYGSITSPGYNFFGNRQGITGFNVNDFVDLDPNVGTLQATGGSLPTCAPLPGSYCIDYGSASGAPAADQRGVSRPQGAGVDIGAVEVVIAKPLTGQSVRDGSGFSFNVIFDVTNSYKIRGSTNLTTWIDLTNYPSGGAQRFLDTAATNLSRRYYRAVTN